jgi:hypothetical protein
MRSSIIDLERVIECAEIELENRLSAFDDLSALEQSEVLPLSILAAEIRINSIIAHLENAKNELEQFLEY